MELSQNIYRNDENKREKFFFSKTIKKQIKDHFIEFLHTEFDYRINLNNYFSKKPFFKLIFAFYF